MLTLADSLAAWGSHEFPQRFKAEVEQLPAAQLPLQQALAHSSYVSDEPFTVLVKSIEDDAAAIHVTAAILYSGIIAGCSCADDPTPQSTLPEQCEVQFDIDKRSGLTAVSLLPS